MRARSNLSLYYAGVSNSSPNWIMQQNPSGLVIKADDRERDSGIAMMLREQFQMDVVEERLGSGDYVIGEKLVVERKTVDDLALSIVDGRLFQQVLRMKQRFETALLIIEGRKPRRSETLCH